MSQMLWPAVLLLALTIGGCAQTSLGRNAVSFVPSNVDVSAQRVEGLKTRAVRSYEANRQVRVLIVNGMATDAHGYSFELQRQIGEGIDAPTCEKDRIVTLDPPTFRLGPENEERFEFPPATLRITEWENSGQEIHRVIFYEVLWTPYADAVTDQFLAPYETNTRFATNPEWTHCEGEPDRPSSSERRIEGRNRPERALINSILKENVMVGGLTDAVLTIGPLGVAARDAIRQGICIMAADALAAPPTSDEAPRCQLTADTLARFGGADGVAVHLDGHEFAFLTYSLGSFMLLDALDEFRLWPGDLGPPELTCKLVAPLLDKTPVYMFSNQVSLSLTAHPHFGCDTESNCELYGEFGDRSILLADPRDHGHTMSPRNTCDVTTRLDVIAFNDPNDIMGYRIPDYLVDSPLIDRVVNVRVKNPAFR
ncbi:MAG: hypothetical protein AAFY56_22705, partial [Pseudomonadota bacterium]